MKKLQIKKALPACLLLFALLVVLNLLYIPECDELYFTAWKFASVKDRLLSAPVQDSPAVIGLMHNGRLLGNFLGVAQSQLLFSPVGWLRAVLFALILVALGLLIRRAACPQSSPGLGAAFFLLLCAPVCYYANVYSWGVSFINYILPLFGFLFCFLLLQRQTAPGVPLLIAAFLSAFASQLFNETFTISMCAFAVLVLFCRKAPRAARLTVAAGFLLGALCMFLNPEYRTVAAGDAIYSVKLTLSKAYEACAEIAKTAYLCNLPIILLLGGLLCANLLRQGARFRLPAILIAVIGIGCAAVSVIDRFAVPLPRYVLIFSCALLLLSWLTGSLCLQDRSQQSRVLLFLLLSVISVLPLLVLKQQLSARMYFECYVLQAMAVLCLLPEQVRHPAALRSVLLAFCALWLCGMIVIYGQNYQVHTQRVALGQTEIENGAQELTLPLVPYTEFATNEAVGKGDLSFLLFKDEPFDTKLTFVPYQDAPEPYRQDALPFFFLPFLK